MPRARLKQITLRAFRSFVNEAVLDFDESGMYLVKGRNSDSNGSSGSGKSSLLLAITYLLGFCRFPATELQSWLTDEPLRVEGVFEVAAGELRISRGQKLQVSLNGVAIKGGSAALEAEITKHMGIDVPLLAALTYRGQKQPGLFLSMTDSGKKEFLTKLLDLGQFEVAYEQSGEISKKMEAMVSAQEYVVAAGRDRLQQLISNHQPCDLKPEEDLVRQIEEGSAARDRMAEHVQGLRIKLRTAEAAIETEAARIRETCFPHLQQLQKLVTDLRSTKPDVGPIDRSGQLEISENLKQAQAFLTQVQIEDNARRLAQGREADSTYASMMLIEKRLAEQPSLQRLANASAELEQAKGDICPTCKRTWAGAQALVATLVSEIATITAKLGETEALRSQAAVLRDRFRQQSDFVPSPEVDELKGVIAQLRSQLNDEQAQFEARAKLLRAELDTRIAETEADLQLNRAKLLDDIERYRSNASLQLDRDTEALEVMERDLNLAHYLVDGLRGSLNQVRIDNARANERQSLFDSQVANETASVEAAQNLLDETKRKRDAELDFQNLIGREGFLGAIFDEVLWEISEETNQILAAFPNTAHVTVRFRSESVSEKGTIKKSIVPVVVVGGHECKLKSGLSGGMETAVELAVDLAVAAVVSRRSGVVPNWLILDESFEGLGVVEKEACMEILKGFAASKLVLVVDHTSEFKEMFTNTILIDHQNGQSTLSAGA